MPELAEVETVRNTLKMRILNKKIKDVNVLYDKMLENDVDFFKDALVGNEFVDILRRGKWLIFELHEYYLLSHLRMEGKFFIRNHDEEIVKHEHVIITFEDGTDLRYHDTRKFGKMQVVSKSHLMDVEAIKKQGREPIDGTLTKEYLLESFKKKTMPIKTALLDQEIISGLGNIYADEVLFASRIHPLRKANTLTINECDKIVKASREILLKAIEMGGTTIKSYTSSLGVTGRFQQYLKVHKREGENCPICNSKIKRIKVGGRSTYFCEVCQK